MHLRTTLLAAAAALLALAGSSPAQNPPLTTTRVAQGLARPLFVTAPAGDLQRAFIVEQRTNAPATGRLRILDITTNTLQAASYLEIAGVNSGDEEGLLGLAFHPNFASNGFFYVYYTTGGNNTVRRFQANAPYMTSTSADAASNTQVLTINHPTNSNHNGGWIAFGPDGYLYIGSGDGGSGNDPPNNGQNLNALLGKMLRIDVDGDDFPGDATKNYRIPAGNPYAGGGGLPEIWAHGLRNPWRNAFDPATGQLYIADVGQNAVEEINVEPANTPGRNYGWRCMEGNNCTGLSGCTCNSPALTMPVHAYSHSFGCSITGGFVYRGNAICGLQGTYFFADYCQATIWSFRYTGSNNPPVTNRTAELAPGGGLSITAITGFGTDASGEIYICKRGTGANGEVYKIIPRPTITDCNGNGTHDGCDIQNGTSADTNGNGIPDECESTITAYCFGDGSGTACPCGNAGAAGNGCASSVNTAGANLAGFGTASISNDSLLLAGSGMPNSSALYFQGTTQTAGGAGAVFGDGLRCAAGTVIRLATKTNNAGQSSYPDPFDLPISIRGGISFGPQTRTYQCWYRNAAAFCTPDTFNLTNGLSVTWVN
ncbi:MAG: PQQ-dependent sugar dehydrogenase [Planctomycetes bacterium]|nr:PQQ-dependent sugar dehydrogenase [Planctomycetota bacterium]